MSFGLLEIAVIAAFVLVIAGPDKIGALFRRVMQQADKVDEVVDQLPPTRHTVGWKAVRKGMRTLDALSSPQEPSEAEEVDGPEPRSDRGRGQ